jgi:Domain of unknown function (DUF6371)
MNGLTLEKYRGSASRYTCPACGRAKKFSRYIDTETGSYLSDTVGRCDRESSCGYHLKPKEYFADNPNLRDGNGWTLLRKPSIPRTLNPRSNREYALEGNYATRFEMKKPDYIDRSYLIDTLDSERYQTNAFVQFLLGLFPSNPEDIWQAVNDYMIGSTKDGKTIFWQVDRNRRVRTGKIIKYDSRTGKRLKDVHPNWTHSELKKAGWIKPGFDLQQCFFGEHLLRTYPGLPIAIVEAEKSAVIGSICKGVFPDLVWLACGGKSNLNAERLSRLGRDRKIILYPDADGFDKWQGIASGARSQGLTVKVSDLIEKQATDAEKADGADLADYLIRLQRQRNDRATREPFRDLIEERLAIMTIDGGLTEEQAEADIIASGFYQDAIRSVLEPAMKDSARE